MSYTILYRASVGREMRRLDAGATRRVDAAIRALADDPRPPGCLKLSGPSGLWRIRAGDWRVIYAIDDAARTVTVTTVAHRRESYRGL